MEFPIGSSIILVLLLTLWFPMDTNPAAAAERAGDTAQGTKRALLIGINKYKAVPKLQGSLNDIETMRQVLLTRWGFAEQNIAVVKDEAATRAGMLAALEQLVQDAGPSDTVYFHYSGHGSQVEDLNGDEPDDHLDETLVPQDGRSGDVRDITDDELDAIFARLRSKNALIVLDSCHSGTATRSLDIRTRSIPRDMRIDIYKKADAATPKTRAIVPVITSRYVVMTGAASYQEALDGPVDGRYHGFFTYALSRSLTTSSPQASPREVFTGVERELKRIQTHFGRSSMPEPQLEAPPALLDKALLGSGQSATGSLSSTRLPWIETQIGSAGQVTLINGPILGAAPGSIWSLYPPGETRFVPGQAIAVATVTQMTGKDATATLQSTSTKIPSGARAVLLLPAPTGDRIPIRLLDIPQERRRSIEETIKTNLKDAELVGPDQPARFSVDVQGDTLRLLAADGLQVVATFGLNEPWGAGMAMVISRSANASELLTLDNPSSQLKIDVRVANAATPKPTVSTRGIKVVADTHAAKYRIRRKGKPRTEHNSLQLEIRVSADSYITIVDIDSEGGANLLFPNAYQQRSFYGDGFIRAGESILIPDSIRPGNKAGFYWDYSPPKGTDTIRVFTSTDLQTAQMIRDRIQELQSSAAQTRGGVGTRSVTSALRNLRQGLSTRGLVRVYDPTSHVPGQASSDVPNPIEGAPALPEGTSTTPAPPVDAPISTVPDMAGSGNSLPIPSAVTTDWAATSLSIVISD